MKVVSEGNLDFDAFMRRPLFAHLATTQDGVARSSPVWFLWEDDALWIIGNDRHDTFPARIRREPRCAIGIVDLDVATGKVHHVGFRGTATVESFDQDRAVRKLSKYLGPDRERWDPKRFSLKNADGSLLWIRFKPETAVLRDQSYSIGS